MPLNDISSQGKPVETTHEWCLLGQRFCPTCKLLNSPGHISWKPAEATRLPCQWLCRWKYSRQPEDRHVCASFPHPCMGVMWKGPDGCHAPSGFALKLNHTVPGERIIFRASSKQTCSWFQKQTLHHLSRMLSGNMTLRKGPGREQAGLCFIDRLVKQVGAQETYGRPSFSTIGINVFRNVMYN